VSCALVERIDMGVPFGQLAADGAARDRDRALVEDLRADQPGAFAALVSRYQRPIYYLVLRYVRNDADAADVTQRTFVRVFESIRRFRGASTLRTWMYRIAINLAKNHLRDHRREQPAEIPDHALVADPVGEGRLVQAQASAALRAAIAHLPPKQRLVLELRIYDELPFGEVAELADCTENAAKVNFHHALKRLRALLGAPGPGQTP
jgi:RNA polymerase sigma-70 factor (ECF subfamily)